MIQLQKNILPRQRSESTSKWNCCCIRWCHFNRIYPLLSNGWAQPGETGTLISNGDEYRLTDAFFALDSVIIVHQMNAEALLVFKVGDRVNMFLDREMHYRHMWMHTSLQLMCHLIMDLATGVLVEIDNRIDFDWQGQVVDWNDSFNQ